MPDSEQLPAVRDDLLEALSTLGLTLNILSRLTPDTYTPTIPQLRYVAGRIILGRGISHREVCKRVGVNPKTAESWIYQHQELRTCLWRARRWAFAKDVDAVWDVVRKQALEGKTTAYKLYLEHFDPDFDTRVPCQTKMEHSQERDIEVIAQAAKTEPMGPPELPAPAEKPGGEG